MELSHIFNIIIIILILHLIIINIDFKKKFDFNEKINDNKEINENYDDYYEKSPQDELLDFINNDILPSNSYSSNNNNSNFKENVMKTKDFYNIEKKVEFKDPIEDINLNNDNKFSDYFNTENENNQQTKITDLRAGKDDAIYHNPI